MKLMNGKGEAVYFNVVSKNGKYRYVICAASGQTLTNRDKGPCKSRTFSSESSADKYLARYGYTQVV